MSGETDAAGIRSVRRVPVVWWAVGGYLAVRLVGVLMLWAALGWSAPDLVHALAYRYDAQWLIRIARDGYDDGTPNPRNLAFFPLFPLLVRGLGFLGLLPAALLVTWTAGAACAVALFRIGRRVSGDAVGVLLAVLWGVIPHAITESMAYTEALFTALAAWALWAVLARRFVTAAVLCVFAGLTRATAWTVIAVVCIAALVELIRTRARSWRAWLAVVVAPVGFCAYVVWVSLRVGSLTGWFDVQRTWGTQWDGGGYTLRTMITLLMHPIQLQYAVVSLVVAVGVALWIIGCVQRQPWSLLVYSGLVLVTAIGAAGYYHSKARLIVPAFPLLLPVARWVSRLGTVGRVLVVAAAAVLSGWFGAYLLTDARYSP